MLREHGTMRGAWQHKYMGEWNCPDCAAARNEYQGKLRFRSGRQHVLPRCHQCGSAFVVDHECSMASA